MDIKRLSQYRATVREIKMLESRISNLRNKDYVSDVVSGSLAVFPYTKHNITVKGYDAEVSDELFELERILSERKAKLAAELRSIEIFINTVDDSEMRQILQHRYIDGLSWQQIAFIIGKHDEGTPRKKHNRFLKFFSKCPKIPN